MFALQRQIVGHPEQPAAQIVAGFAVPHVLKQGKECFLNHLLGVGNRQTEAQQVPPQPVPKLIEPATTSSSRRDLAARLSTLPARPGRASERASASHMLISNIPAQAFLFKAFLRLRQPNRANGRERTFHRTSRPHTRKYREQIAPVPNLGIMDLRVSIRRGVLWLPIICLQAVLSPGQIPAAEVLIDVKDPSGAAMEVSGKLENLASGTIRRFRTEMRGHYKLENVSPGRYRLEITRKGFATQSLLLDVHATTPLERTIVMALGEMADDIQVVATTPLAGVGLSPTEFLPLCRRPPRATWNTAIRRTSPIS